jgi:ADP-ribosyl-[dinitrogen reductase] hydrolase
MIKTSQTHPLQINNVQPPGVPGQIGMTFCPGKVRKHSLSGGEWNRDLATDLAVIQQWGARAIVTLMESHELASHQVHDLPMMIPEGIEFFHLPMPDGGVPDTAWEQQWEKTGAVIRDLLSRGEKVLIHCLGGLGRTGLVAAKILVEFGAPPAAAIRQVRAARPGTIENTRQEQYVKKQKPLPKRTATSLQQFPRPYHRIEPGMASRFRGCLLGGAVGDALGAAVEFMDIDAIHKAFGPAGITDFAPAYGRVGAITDDTQMTLFTAEGFLRGYVRVVLKGIGPAFDSVTRHAYLRWLHTQGYPVSFMEPGPDGWLMTLPDLFHRRAPGNTCLSALSAKHDHFGVPAQNQSKGCGGVMRVAPIGLFAARLSMKFEDPRQIAFDWAVEAAALTHGHPTGQLAAGVFAAIIFDLASGQQPQEALNAARRILETKTGHVETLAAMDAAEDLAAGDSNDPDNLRRLGEGWVAEEALALSIYCMLRARNFEDGVTMAVNITGDSDSTGSMTGNLLGALYGVHEIPERWASKVELREPILEIADDLATFPDWEIPESGDSYWWNRYPGW